MFSYIFCLKVIAFWFIGTSSVGGETNSTYCVFRDVNLTITNKTASCWIGRNEFTGRLTEDSRKICSNISSGRPCYDTVFMKEKEILTDNNGANITTGYGFNLTYTTTLWPIDHISSRLECGSSYLCSFSGRNPDKNSLCSLSYSSHYKQNDEIYRILEEADRILPLYLHPYELKVTVPFLNKKFKTASFNCNFTVFLGDEILASASTPITLIDSEPVVHSSSDTGLVLLTDNTKPKCVGDGWPVPRAKWELREWPKGDRNNFNGKKSKDQTFERRGGSYKYSCDVTQGNTTARQWMVLIKGDTKKLSGNSKTKILSRGEREIITYHVNSSNWDPEPTGFGWTCPDGEEHKIDKEKSATEIVIPLKNCTTAGLGEFTLWLEISMSWKRPSQTSTYRKEDVITVSESMRSFAAAAATDRDHRKSDPVATSHWYFVGLAILATLVAVAMALIYKSVKKNQIKVTDLDTKLSLDKVKTKMGINALYGRTDVGEDESLLSRIPHIEKECLTLDQVLGSGQFGKVLKGTLSIEEEDGTTMEVEVAVKCLMQSAENDGASKEFLKEVVTMYQFDHPNVLKLLGYCTDFEEYMIVSEFMSQGNLKDFLMSREPDELTLSDKLYMCYQVSCGVEHIISRNVVHRDLAARNCLVGPNLLVKVADFGLSRTLSMSNYYQKVGGQVPIRWMAPEATKLGRYTPESDVWAFGVLMWEVYTEGHFPYSGYSNEEVQQMVDDGFKLHPPPHCTEEISILMQATWEREPKDRPTMQIIKSRLHQMLRSSDPVVRNALYTTPFLEDEEQACGSWTLPPPCNYSNPGIQVTAANRYTTEPYQKETSL